jgi:hypothetical protein
MTSLVEFNKTISERGAPPPNRAILLQLCDTDTKSFEEKENRNVEDVGTKYASFRVIAIEGAEQKWHRGRRRAARATSVYRKRARKNKERLSRRP